jgi:nitrous oxidase accessory protein NosD
MRKLLLVFAISTLSFASATAQSVRTFVASYGNDANPCNLSQPCRNFAAAIAAVNAGGEVVALDSAGYGPVTITKSVSLIAPRAVYAAIAPTTGHAITVSAGSGGVVRLRGLFLTAHGAHSAIFYDSGDRLYVDDVSISRFTAESIYVENPTAVLTMKNCTIRSANQAIQFSGYPGGTARLTLQHVQLLDSGSGVDVDFADVTIVESSIAGNGIGVRLFENASVNIRSSAIVQNDFGVRVSNQSAVARLSDNSLADNDIALDVQAGMIISLGDNVVARNGSGETFSSTIPLQ